VGRYNVVIKYPNGKSEVVRIQDLPNMPSDIERAEWKGYLHITPSDITKYIKGRQEVLSLNIKR